jgi:hypothetical protein
MRLRQTVYDGLARFDEASDHFEAALVVARESGDRQREGQFLSYLACCMPARPSSSTHAIAWIPARLCYAQCATE